MKTNEIWKNVYGYENIYQVSQLGNIKHRKNNKWEILKQTNKNGWYFSVKLIKDNIVKGCKLHRLVAQAFIPNPKHLPCVNHIDGNKQNNNINNLEWVTYKENINKAKEMGLWVYNKPYKCKKIYQYSLNGNYINEYDSSKDAYRKTGVCATDILYVAHNLRKTAGNYIWSFKKGVVLC